MLYAYILFAVSLFMTPVLTDEQLERYWSGRPQAIGIDISPQYIHAVQYNATTEEFTNLASWPCSDQFGSFMLELYHRKKIIDGNWHADYFAYEKWWPLRKIVHSTSLTSWIGDRVSQLSKEYRYSWNDNLDDIIGANPTTYLTWKDWLMSIFSGQNSRSKETSEEDSFASGSLPLSTSNFIDVFASAIESIKTKVLEIHGVNITSAVIAKPSYIYNGLEKLIDRACAQANLEVLDRKGRAEAARSIPIKAGKSEVLVLEQSGYEFSLSRLSSSMGRDDLSASWIPVRLMMEMLQSIGFVANGTAESLNAATQRLAVEIVRARRNMKFAYKDDLDLFDEEETTIVVPNFGSEGFTFEHSLSGAEISRAEDAYTAAVQLAIEAMLLKHDKIYQYQKDNDLLEELGSDREDPQSHLIELAKTIPHPEAASGGSWWDPVDALLVIADFPDAALIQRAAERAIEGITEKKCSNVFDQDYVKYDIVARGAALEASDWVGYWDAEERSRKCSEEEDFYKCLDDEMGEEQEGEEQVAHEEL